MNFLFKFRRLKKKYCYMIFQLVHNIFFLIMDFVNFSNFHIISLNSYDQYLLVLQILENSGRYWVTSIYQYLYQYCRYWKILVKYWQYQYCGRLLHFIRIFSCVFLGAGIWSRAIQCYSITEK